MCNERIEGMGGEFWQSIIRAKRDGNRKRVSGEVADKAGKAAKDAAAAATDMLATGAPNVRIRENVMQIGVPVMVGAMGLETKVVVFGRGTFVKKDNGFVFEPAELYLGSCPVQRLPLVSGYVRNKFLNAATVPEDIAAAWAKLANVTVEGNTLKLAMQ